MKTDIPTNGAMVKNHISSKTGFGYLATRRTSCLLWFQACQVLPLDLHQLQGHLRDRRVIPHHLLHPHLLHLQEVKFRFENEKMGLIVTPLRCKCQLRLMIDVKRREDLVKHSVYTHFPKDRNCEICKRTKIARAPCRRRKGEAVPRADKFGDFITADHKVLGDTCESRNNHRYAVVVQDLATQWIQAYPCKTNTSQETQRSLQKFLEPERRPKVIDIDNSLEFGKAREDLSWNHCTSAPHRSETNGMAERAVRRVKEGTSAVLLQSGLNESWWADSMECLHLSAKRHRFMI